MAANHIHDDKSAMMEYGVDLAKYITYVLAEPSTQNAPCAGPETIES